jgi:hypothetical protein
MPAGGFLGSEAEPSLEQARGHPGGSLGPRRVLRQPVPLRYGNRAGGAIPKKQAPSTSRRGVPFALTAEGCDRPVGQCVNGRGLCEGKWSNIGPLIRLSAARLQN